MEKVSEDGKMVTVRVVERPSLVTGQPVTWRDARLYLLKIVCSYVSG